MSRRPSPQVAHKKAAPYCVKRCDGEPITRSDLQYDLLHHIFSDQHAVFTDPNPTLRGDPAGTKTTFHDLYINTLVRSPRSSKVLREKMLDTPEFGTDFAKLALLANVGRINTTMAFFPEMKTAIRTYHPIPALQKTNGNLQDAPRIKNILKSCLLDGESKAGVPSTPVDILARSRSGTIPPTSVVNLIFVMANHAAPLAQMHFDNTLDFLNLFLPISVSSASRARAFLWLCYHYLESSSDNTSSLRNPFADPHTAHPNKIPPLVTLTQEEMERENVDSEEEIVWGQKMALQRKEFQAKMDKGKDRKGSDVEDDGADGTEDGEANKSKGKAKSKGKGKIGTKDVAATKASAKEKKAAADKARRERQKEAKREREAATPGLDTEDIGRDDFHPSTSQTLEQDRYRLQPQISQKLHSHSTRPSRRIHTPSPPHSHRYSPHKLNPVSTTGTTKLHAQRPYLQPHNSHRHPKESAKSPQRSMLQHAWHVVTTTDPLLDSDEDLDDEHVRVDYLRKLHIVSRLRGKEPTPEYQPQHMDVDVDPGLFNGRRNVPVGPP